LPTDWPVIFRRPVTVPSWWPWPTDSLPLNFVPNLPSWCRNFLLQRGW
jgi:hypothetical protein